MQETAHKQKRITLKTVHQMLYGMDLDRYGKVKCSKIEQMLPKLMTMVEGEMVAMV